MGGFFISTSTRATSYLLFGGFLLLLLPSIATIFLLYFNFHYYY